MWGLERELPERIRGKKQHLPLFRYTDDSPIKREHIQKYLELAALAVGVPADRMGSHSLRIGGATAMYHVVGDLQQVRRFGRWASDAFHGYLWESHELVENLAHRMARDMSELTAPR